MELSAAGLYYSDPYTYAKRQGMINETSHPERAQPAKIEETPVTPHPSPVTELFEPLSSRDYFASQGIKLSESAMGNDRLGTQLKSFTAWLKTMKKTQPVQSGSVTTDEQLAVKLAEDSNKRAEVVTEAMAEAFIMQGKREQARDIYRRLGLENPSKSAYFAAKSDVLN